MHQPTTPASLLLPQSLPLSSSLLRLKKKDERKNLKLQGTPRQRPRKQIKRKCPLKHKEQDTKPAPKLCKERSPRMGIGNLGGWINLDHRRHRDPLLVFYLQPHPRHCSDNSLHEGRMPQPKTVGRNCPWPVTHKSFLKKPFCSATEK